MGRMVLTVLGMVAEMELGFIRDRLRAGIDAAKAKGIYKGRPVTFDRAASCRHAKKEWAPLRSPRLSDASEGMSRKRSRPQD
jgi:DNA invertase Pin-like site-specific DNA recombinase